MIRRAGVMRSWRPKRGTTVRCDSLCRGATATSKLTQIQNVRQKLFVVSRKPGGIQKYLITARSVIEIEVMEAHLR